MAVGDIYRLFIKFDDQSGGKERYTVEIGQIRLGIIIMDSITSQYQNKSEFIKKQYYPIKDWQQAGLHKPSYIDIKSSRTYELSDVLKMGKYTGQLTLRDVQDLAEFISSYKNRLKELKRK
jgi:mRNA interferase MazF